MSEALNVSRQLHQHALSCIEAIKAIKPYCSEENPEGVLGVVGDFCNGLEKPVETVRQCMAKLQAFSGKMRLQSEILQKRVKADDHGVFAIEAEQKALEDTYKMSCEVNMEMEKAVEKLVGRTFDLPHLELGRLHNLQCELDSVDRKRLAAKATLVSLKNEAARIREEICMLTFRLKSQLAEKRTLLEETLNSTVQEIKSQEACVMELRDKRVEHSLKFDEAQNKAGLAEAQRRENFQNYLSSRLELLDQCQRNLNHQLESWRSDRNANQKANLEKGSLSRWWNSCEKIDQRCQSKIYELQREVSKHDAEAKDLQKLRREADVEQDEPKQQCWSLSAIDPVLASEQDRLSGLKEYAERLREELELLELEAAEIGKENLMREQELADLENRIATETKEIDDLDEKKIALDDERVCGISEALGVSDYVGNLDDLNNLESFASAIVSLDHSFREIWESAFEMVATSKSILAEIGVRMEVLPTLLTQKTGHEQPQSKDDLYDQICELGEPFKPVAELLREKNCDVSQFLDEKWEESFLTTTIKDELNHARMGKLLRLRSKLNKPKEIRETMKLLDDLIQKNYRHNLRTTGLSGSTSENASTNTPAIQN
eukprot:TRINITY_DN38957_c0_g1_i1.p1 TRINITY_DN38957_c0_g1~~TRINITY_DN38957_c0_g1_i1.p1  ORF type:complete len:604 (-),score=168.84 TRINITY_DN38957_c0_g1_i1:50-1861(-)